MRDIVYEEESMTKRRYKARRRLIKRLAKKLGIEIKHVEVLP